MRSEINSVKEWTRKRGGRIEGKGNKKMRQQKMAAMEGGGLDGWGVKQVKKQKRGERIRGKWSERSWRTECNNIDRESDMEIIKDKKNIWKN